MRRETYTNWTRKLYHNPVGMIAFMRSHFGSNRKTLNAKVEIRTHCTLNANHSRDIFMTVIAVV
jgi:hypothetical protein